MQFESSSGDQVKVHVMYHFFKIFSRFWCTHHHLRAIEIPQAIYLESKEWTTENGFITSTEKKRRSVLLQHYKDIRHNLYHSKTSSAHQEDTSTLPSSFQKLLAQVVPSGVDFSPEASFAQIGGDSLSAARLVNLMKSQGANVTSRQLFEYPLSHIAQLLESNEQMVPLIKPSIDWSSEWQIPADFPKRNLNINKEQQIHVLVSGCTGFLGPVLVAEILSQYPSNVMVYCLIRANSAENAFNRLQEDMTKAGVWYLASPFVH